MKDTPAAVEKMYHDLLMSRSPAERVRMACSMHATATTIIRAGIPDHAWDTEKDLRIEVFKRFYREDCCLPFAAIRIRYHPLFRFTSETRRPIRYDPW